jgi:hypothetical protein
MEGGGGGHRGAGGARSRGRRTVAHGGPLRSGRTVAVEFAKAERPRSPSATCSAGPAHALAPAGGGGGGLARVVSPAACELGI